MTNTKPVPVEPLATVYDAYDTGCDWHCRYPPAVGAKIYDQSAIDSLQSALQVSRHNSGVTMDELGEMRDRAEKADAENAALRLELARLNGEIPFTLKRQRTETDLAEALAKLEKP